MERKFRVISEEIGYWEASENPLSADVGVIRENGQLWFYDVGDGEENADPRMEGANIVLSHFHRDHTGNIERIHEGTLYGSKETCRHMGRGTIVEQERTEGRLRIFPLPSSHARGCLGLEVDGRYAFVGDALYGRMKAGRCVYNAQFLKEEITVLKGLRARRIRKERLFKGSVAVLCSRVPYFCQILHSASPRHMLFRPQTACPYTDILHDLLGKVNHAANP